MGKSTGKKKSSGAQFDDANSRNSKSNEHNLGELEIRGGYGKTFGNGTRYDRGWEQIVPEKGLRRISAQI